MKKIASFVALVLISAMSFAAVSITVKPSSVDFGTQSIKGKTEVSGSITFDVEYSGLLEYCGVVFEDDEMPAENASFWITGTKTSGWIYGGDTWTAAEGKGLTLNYYADHAGTYTGKIRFYSYSDSDWEVKTPYVYMTMKLVVTNEAIVAKTIPFERVTSLSDGDTIIFVSEAAGAVSGPLYTTYLQAITTDVTINTTDHTAEVPEATVQMFRAVKYSGNWQFYTVETTPQRLHLDITGSGAFTYADTEANKILANWAVSFDSNGNATVSKPDDTFPVEFNGDRFKPYKNPQNTTYQLYKKKGAAAEIKSKLEISAIDFGTVELDEEKEVVVTYTAENLTEDIMWDITGADKALFSVTPSTSTNRTSGSVTVKYLGTAGAVKTIDAKLYALTQDAALDDLEKEIPISITLAASTIKLTKIEFVGAPDSLVKGKSIDLKPYLVFTPGNAEDKSLTWTVDKSYQGSVADGVYTALNVTGNVTITATSVKVPSVSASVTLMQYEPKPASITLDKHEITTTVGEVVTLQGIVGPDGASQDCYFTIRNKDVLSYAKGDVTGSAKLTAKAVSTEGTWVVVNPKNYQTILDSCLVKVNPITVESVVFYPDSKELAVGATYQLAPVVTPSAAASQYTASYESNNTSVATVSETGLVTAVAEGTAEITCTLGGKSGKITISVVGATFFTKATSAANMQVGDTIILFGTTGSENLIAGAVNTSKTCLDTILGGIQVSGNTVACPRALVFIVGGTKDAYTLTAEGTTSTLATSDNTKLAYSSSKNTWKFVDGTDGVNILNANYATASPLKYIGYNTSSKMIRMYAANNTSKQMVVYVRPYNAPALPPVEQVTLDQTEYSTHVGDAAVTLKATVTPSDADQEIVWTSSDETIATVNASGKVVPKSVGDVTITAKAKTDETKYATCLVHVIAWTVEYVEFNYSGDLTIEVGETVEDVQATAYPTGHGFKVDYYTSNENIATVTIGGKITGVAEGDAVITAKSGDKEATLNVHVTAKAVPEEKGAITVADFLKAKDDFNIYTLTGWVTNIKEDSDGVPYQRGEFTLNDATGSIAIYGILTQAGVENKFWDMDIEEKDTVTLKGSYDEYKGAPQIKNATLVEVKKYVEPETPTTIDAVRANKQATKVLREGQIIIIREEKEYDVVGRRVK